MFSSRRVRGEQGLVFQLSDSAAFWRISSSDGLEKTVRGALVHSLPAIGRHHSSFCVGRILDNNPLTALPAGALDALTALRKLCVCPRLSFIDIVYIDIRGSNAVRGVAASQEPARHFFGGGGCGRVSSPDGLDRAVRVDSFLA